MSRAVERPRPALDHPPPAVQHADHLVAGVERPSGDRADHRVQPGAVAAAGEDPDPHPGESYRSFRPAPPQPMK